LGNDKPRKERTADKTEATKRFDVIIMQILYHILDDSEDYFAYAFSTPFGKVMCETLGR
jgi:hypothetical protein